MNSKIPIILLAFAALASHAAEPLLLQWGTIHTGAPAAQAESAAIKTKLAKKSAATLHSAAAETRAAYIVQFPAAVTEAQRTWLESATQVRGYIPENAYIVWATPSEMAAIVANPDVFWTGEWKKEYKTVRVPAAKRTAAAKSAAATDADTARIYTLLWTTDLSTGEWTELPLGVGNPSTANPLPIVDTPSLFVCVRVELPSLR